VRFALVGGFAVATRAEPRFTRDVDLAVAVGDDAQAESLVRDLGNAGYRVISVVEQEAVGRLATIRLQPAGEDDPAVLDLLFASSGIESELVAAADTLAVVPGLTLPVATTGHLLALKVLSRDDRRRPQDVADLRALLRVATPKDVSTARSALALIQQRGFHRNRSLGPELDRAIAEAR
jgi:hypothetical protein